MSEKMFEVAVRTKMRFPFRGQISVEDLFDLSVHDLDSIFKILNSQLKQTKEESLLDTKSKQDKEIEIKIEIVKYVVKVKLEEENQRLKARERREQKQKILEIMATKQDESLKGKSIEELEKMLDDLE